MRWPLLLFVALVSAVGVRSAAALDEEVEYLTVDPTSENFGQLVSVSEAQIATVNGSTVLIYTCETHVDSCVLEESVAIPLSDDYAIVSLSYSAPLLAVGLSPTDDKRGKDKEDKEKKGEEEEGAAALLTYMCRSSSELDCHLGGDILQLEPAETEIQIAASYPWLAVAYPGKSAFLLDCTSGSCGPAASLVGDEADPTYRSIDVSYESRLVVLGGDGMSQVFSCDGESSSLECTFVASFANLPNDSGSKSQTRTDDKTTTTTTTTWRTAAAAGGPAPVAVSNNLVVGGEIDDSVGLYTCSKEGCDDAVRHGPQDSENPGGFATTTSARASHVVIGEPDASGGGAVYVFERCPDSEGCDAAPVLVGAQSNATTLFLSRFGRSVSVGARILAVGTDSQVIAVYRLAKPPLSALAIAAIVVLCLLTAGGIGCIFLIWPYSKTKLYENVSTQEERDEELRRQA